MTMLEFMKSLFKAKKEPQEVEEIPFEKVEEWLNKHTSDIIEDIDGEINLIYEQLQEEAKSLREKLDVLKNAQLRNETIALRAKQIMGGNREAYISKVTAFLDSIDLSNRGYFSGKRFYNDFLTKIELLNNSTLKAYYVLQEFFADESGEIAKNLKKMDGHVREMKETIEESPLYNLDNVQAKLNELKEKQQILLKTNKNIEEKRKELESHRAGREKIERKIYFIKKSQAFQQYNELFQQKESLAATLKKLEQDIINEFSLLERPLKKHARIVINDKLVQEYANNPLNALLADRNLEIVSILATLKNNIVKEEVEIKDRQRYKTIAILEKLHRGYFENYLSQYHCVKAKKQEVDHLMLTNKVTQDYNELLYRQEHLLEKCKRTIEEINLLEKRKSRIDLKGVKQELEKYLSMISANEIRIVEKTEEGENTKEGNSADVAKNLPANENLGNLPANENPENLPANENLENLSADEAEQQPNNHKEDIPQEQQEK